MGAWYLVSGSVRLRRCPEVDAIIDGLRDLRGDEFEVATTDAGPGAVELAFRGGSEFTDAGADERDGMLWSLGPRAPEAAIFVGECDGERRVVVGEPPGEPCPSAGGIPIPGLVR